MTLHQGCSEEAFAVATVATVILERCAQILGAF